MKAQNKNPEKLEIQLMNTELSLEEILCHHLKYFNILLKFNNQLISKNIWELYFSLVCCSFLWNFYFIYFSVF